MVARKIRAILTDFDGVILESVELKGNIFAEVFNDYPKQLEQIKYYHRANGGLSRSKKIEYICRSILKIPLTDSIMKERIDKFSDIAKKTILTCPCVNGAENFLMEYSKRIPIYVISGTPEEELCEIIYERGMNKYFAGIMGSPVDKAIHMQNLLNRNGWKPDELIFIGDSQEDYRASFLNSIPFIMRVYPHCNDMLPRLGVEYCVMDMQELMRYCSCSLQFPS